MSTALKEYLLQKGRPGYGSGFATKTAGQLFTESEAYKKFLNSGQNQSAPKRCCQAQPETAYSGQAIASTLGIYGVVITNKE